MSSILRASDLTGLDIPFAAEVQAGVQATYVQPLASATLTYYLSAHYQDEAEMSPFDPNAVATGLRGILLSLRWRTGH